MTPEVCSEPACGLRPLTAPRLSCWRDGFSARVSGCLSAGDCIGWWEGTATVCPQCPSFLCTGSKVR